MVLARGKKNRNFRIWGAYSDSAFFFGSKIGVYVRKMGRCWVIFGAVLRLSNNNKGLKKAFLGFSV